MKELQDYNPYEADEFGPDPEQYTEPDYLGLTNDDIDQSSIYERRLDK